MDLVWISAKLLASASYDGSARIWDTEAAGECIHEVVEHQVKSSKGPYIKDVCKMSGIFDPFPPLVHIWR